MTLIAWKAGVSIVWDQTEHDSYIDSSTREAGAAAEIVAARKTAKYSNWHLSTHPIQLRSKPWAR